VEASYAQRLVRAASRREEKRREEKRREKKRKEEKTPRAPRFKIGNFGPKRE
jgi:hypothetical protein